MTDEKYNKLLEQLKKGLEEFRKDYIYMGVIFEEKDDEIIQYTEKIDIVSEKIQIIINSK